jgi:hypothetical protein
MLVANDTPSLAHATWGLVVATALLVVAAAIPALGALRERRNQGRTRAALLIPDLHMLRSRFEGWTTDIDAAVDPNSEWCDSMLDCNKGDLKILSPLIDAAPNESLHFTSELYILRHLITQARRELQRCERAVLTDPMDRESSGKALRRARNLYLASTETLNEAERLIPVRRRTFRRPRSLRRESFLDHFRRVADEREAKARKSAGGS